MPRRRVITKRGILPDVRHGDKLLSQFINSVMRQGKKSIAEAVCYGALDVIQQKQNTDPLKVFHSAVDNVRPMVEVKSRRVGGASYQVPVEIRSSRRVTLALRWIRTAALNRAGRSMQEKLAAELMDAANKTGVAIKKREDAHRMAEANKAFAHYRW
ncbi:MAG TPA: 30S ribosomal protein S7 [Nitrospirales bacterium]|nr:30S ribosomal protein S7 [Nitrospirales bacterium]